MIQPPELARPKSKWTKADGDVLWWRADRQGKPYVGTPLDLGTARDKYGRLKYVSLFSWEYTHWTPLPLFPQIPEETEK